MKGPANKETAFQNKFNIPFYKSHANLFGTDKAHSTNLKEKCQLGKNRTPMLISESNISVTVKHFCIKM